MKELHDKLIHDKYFEPEVGQRDLACSNKESCRCPTFGLEKQENTNKNIFSNEDLDNISSLCSTFQKIRSRLISEGCSIDSLREKLSN